MVLHPLHSAFKTIMAVDFAKGRYTVIRALFPEGEAFHTPEVADSIHQLTTKVSEVLCFRDLFDYNWL